MSTDMINARDGRQVPMSRRTAIRTGGFAALMAGLVGTTSVVAAPLPPAATLTLNTVVNPDDLAGESRRLLAEYQSFTADEQRLYHELTAQLTPAQAKLLRDYSDTMVNQFVAEEQLHSAELARHIPAFASMLRMVSEHVNISDHDQIGVCCTVAEGFEP